MAFKKMHLGGVWSRDLSGCGGLSKKSCDLHRTGWRTHPQPDRSRDILSLELDSIAPGLPAANEHTK